MTVSRRDAVGQLRRELGPGQGRHVGEPSRDEQEETGDQDDGRRGPRVLAAEPPQRERAHDDPADRIDAGQRAAPDRCVGRLPCADDVDRLADDEHRERDLHHRRPGAGPAERDHEDRERNGAEHPGPRRRPRNPDCVTGDDHLPALVADAGSSTPVITYVGAPRITSHRGRVRRPHPVRPVVVPAPRPARRRSSATRVRPSRRTGRGGASLVGMRRAVEEHRR